MTRPFPNAAAMKQAVAETFQTPLAVLEPGGGGGAQGREARAITLQLAAQLMPINPSAIGKRMGGFDFTTVLYAQRVVNKRADKDPALARKLEQMAQCLLASVAIETDGAID